MNSIPGGRIGGVAIFRVSTQKLPGTRHQQSHSDLGDHSSGPRINLDHSSVASPLLETRHSSALLPNLEVCLSIVGQKSALHPNLEVCPSMVGHSSAVSAPILVVLRLLG